MIRTSTFLAPPKMPATPLALLRSTGELTPGAVRARSVSATLRLPERPCDAPRFLLSLIHVYARNARVGGSRATGDKEKIIN